MVAWDDEVRDIRVFDDCGYVVLDELYRELLGNLVVALIALYPDGVLEELLYFDGECDVRSIEYPFTCETFSRLYTQPNECLKNEV